MSVIFLCFAVFVFGIRNQSDIPDSVEDTETQEVDITQQDTNTTLSQEELDYQSNQDRIFSMTVKKVLICTFDAFIWSCFTIWKIFGLLNL